MQTTAIETTAAYTARLPEKANECDFGDSLEDRALEHLIQTTDNQALIQKCINKGWTLDRFLLEAAQIEDTAFQLRDMKPVHREQFITKINSRQPRKRRFQQKVDYASQACDYCGRTSFDSAGEGCPAYEKQCNGCCPWNHFEAVCRSRQRPNNSSSINRSYKKKQSRNQTEFVAIC